MSACVHCLVLQQLCMCCFMTAQKQERLENDCLCSCRMLFGDEAHILSTKQEIEERYDASFLAQSNQNKATLEKFALLIFLWIMFNIHVFKHSQVSLHTFALITWSCEYYLTILINTNMQEIRVYIMLHCVDWPTKLMISAYLPLTPLLC